MGGITRIPEYNNKHNISANKLHYDYKGLSIGITQLNTNEQHSTSSGSHLDINHDLTGTYFSWEGGLDIFLEYASKVSSRKINNLAKHQMKN